MNSSSSLGNLAFLGTGPWHFLGLPSCPPMPKSLSNNRAHSCH
jgi:hypothetical protein